MHAKTAVADGRWARVGSTNLNLSSWIGNYELDIAVEDERFAQAMEEMYIKDLEHSTEVVLSERHRVRFATKRPRRPLLRPRRLGGGSVSRVGAGAIRISNTVGAAIANRRLLGPAEARVMLIMGLLFSAFAIVSLLWPKWVTVPMAVLSGWLAISLLIRAYKVRTKRKKEDISSGLIRKARFRIVQRKKRKGWRSKKQENVS
jgi:cardiolipin synthase